MQNIRMILSKIKNVIKKKLVREVVKPVNIPVLEQNLLDDKNVLVVGGSGGIGFAIAEKIISSGGTVIITGTSEEKLRKCCMKLGEGASYHVLNLLNVSEIEKTINDIIELLDKDKQIDVLVNAAGVHSSEPFGKITEENYDNIMSINLKSIFFLSQSITNYMIHNEIKGKILNIGSASALKPAWTPYEISKWGLKGFTAGLADKMIPYGIVVNALAPGPVATKMIGLENTKSIKWDGNPSGRVCTPEEVANMAVIMISDIGNMIVGDTVFLSGGSGTICIDK